MKNKLIYLILGIGIGIILTNIVYSLYPKVEYVDLSDDKIIERAMDLGMVKLKESIKIEKSPVEKKEEIKEPEDLKEEEHVLKKEIVIESGSDLSTVAKKLYNENLIQDQEGFIFYVRGKGLDRKIITGIYIIEKGSSYSEIISILTSKSSQKD